MGERLVLRARSYYRIEDPDSVAFQDMDEGRAFSEFLINLVRIGSGLKAVEQEPRE